MAGPAVLVVSVWSVWVRRLTFGSRYDAAGTLSLALFGVGSMLDAPWRQIGTSSLTVVDAATNTVVPPAVGMPEPRRVAVNPDGTVYVTNQNVVSVVARQDSTDGGPGGTGGNGGNAQAPGYNGGSGGAGGDSLWLNGKAGNGGNGGDGVTPGVGGFGGAGGQAGTDGTPGIKGQNGSPSPL